MANLTEKYPKIFETQYNVGLLFQTVLHNQSLVISEFGEYSVNPKKWVSEKVNERFVGVIYQNCFITKILALENEDVPILNTLNNSVTFSVYFSLRIEYFYLNVGSFIYGIKNIKNNPKRGTTDLMGPEHCPISIRCILEKNGDKTYGVVESIEYPPATNIVLCESVIPFDAEKVLVFCMNTMESKARDLVNLHREMIERMIKKLGIINFNEQRQKAPGEVELESVKFGTIAFDLRSFHVINEKFYCPVIKLDEENKGEPSESVVIDIYSRLKNFLLMSYMYQQKYDSSIGL